MYRVKRAFECARDRGDEYMLIMQRKQEDAESLTFCLFGDWYGVQIPRMNFPDYAYVHVLNTARDWEEHEEYLRGLGFEW